ncbi:glycoside hydrolase family 65 protein [Burkholderia territorii]|uniref:glycoside hydrolase family 65 protein n=1 Tax=Burkholderia territorii TaxID=1503055 RepID=UPI0018C52B09|nr:glycoside hydrolase family 65 protein [Burkholderia territorii]
MVNDAYNETYVNQPFIGNGYMGLRIPSAGNGYWVGTQPPDDNTGWPLVPAETSPPYPRYTSALISGYYGDASIVGLPNWSPLTVRDAGGSFDPQTIRASQLSNYSQTTDMQNGLVTTSVTWTSPSGNQAKLVWTMFAHQQFAHLGVVRLDVTPIKWSGSMNVDAFIDLRGIRRASEMSSQRWQDTISNGAEASVIANSTNVKATVAFRVVPPVGLPSSTALNNSNQSGLSWSFSPAVNQTYTFVKYVGIASGADYDLLNPPLAPDNTTQQINLLARSPAIAAQSGTYGTYDQILQAHESAWQAIWQSDVIVDDQHSNLQSIIHAAEYMLYSNLRTGSQHSIAPAGLTSDNYAGHIFWDAETWMYPYLLAAHPEMAKAIIDYRFNALPNALLNVQSGGGGSNLGGYFPWEASNGLLSSDSPWNGIQIHLQADIALSQFQYYMATGDQSWLKDRGWPVLSAIADYYTGRATQNRDGSYSIKIVKAPDEYASGVTDEAYTNGSAILAINLAIQTANSLGYQPHVLWSKVASNLVKPKIDPVKNVHLEYAGFNPNASTNKVKQADVVLLAYPLEYPMTDQQAINDLNYYSPITDPGGPAMTNSVQAVIAAKYGLSSLNKFFSDSYTPYLRGPFKNFNETNSLHPSGGQRNPAYTFLTGAGGFMQTFLNGFAGYRFRQDGIYLSPILSGDAIEGSPLTRVYLKGMHWQGRTYDIDVQPGTTTVLVTSGPAAPVITPDGTVTANPGVPLAIKTRVPVISGNGSRKS